MDTSRPLKVPFGTRMSLLLSELPYHKTCQHPSLSNTERYFPLLTAELPIENGLGHKHGGKHVGNQTDHQSYRKAFDRSRSEQEQEGAGDYLGRVRIDEGQQGLADPRLDRGNHGLTGTQFLADSFKDQDIGIHRHTDGQDDAGDAGKR